VKSHLTSHIVSHSFVTLVSAESQNALSMLPLDTSQYSTSSFGLWVIISCSRPSSNRSLLLHRNRRRKLVKAGFVDARRHHYAFSFTSPDAGSVSRMNLRCVGCPCHRVCATRHQCCSLCALSTSILRPPTARFFLLLRTPLGSAIDIVVLVCSVASTSNPRNLLPYLFTVIS
jgi:hypothetical protein